jgi:BirA family biotin operon repressor/biotin-[acetyl-CoA-carboxylase] ligase
VHEDPAPAASRLAGHRFSELSWVTSTGSTNADLIDAARSGAGERALVADHQAAGRGRLDRSWQAPAGASLLMSVLVRPPFPAQGPQMLSTAVALAAVRSLERLAGLTAGLKWPNDLVVAGAAADGADLKLGGLLSELHLGVGGDAVVVGIGVNVAWAESGFPPELAATATSVDLQGAHVEREDLVVEMLVELDSLDELARTEACEQLMVEHRARCVTLGRRVRVELPGAELSGTAVDLAADGSLEVRDDDGSLHTVSVGDVVHLR